MLRPAITRASFSAAPRGRRLETGASVTATSVVIAVIGRPPRVGESAARSSVVPDTVVCPVRARNTSSSDGRRRVMSTTLMPASSRRRTTSTRLAAPPSTGSDTRRVPRSTVGPLGADVGRAARRPGRASSSSTVTSSTSPARRCFSSSRGAGGDDRAVVDDHDVGRELVGLLEVLRGEEDGGALVHQVAEVGPEVEPVGGVEPGRRLVEQEHPRPGDETGAEVDAAAHAARVRLQLAVGRVGERHPFEHLGRALGGEPLRQAREPPDHLEVLAPGQRLVDRRVLAGETDAPAHRGRLLDDVEAGDARGAARRVRSGSRGCGRGWSCRRRSVRAARPRHPRAPTRSTPHSAWVSPNERAMPSTSTIAFMRSPRFPSCAVLPEGHAVQRLRLDVEAASCSVNAQSASTSARS